MRHARAAAGAEMLIKFGLDFIKIHIARRIAAHRISGRTFGNQRSGQRHIIDRPIQRDAKTVTDLAGANRGKVKATQCITMLPEQAGEKIIVEFFRVVAKTHGPASTHNAVNKVLKAARRMRADK